MLIRFQFIIGLLLLSCAGWSKEPVIKLTPEEEKALSKLKLPGIKLNLDERTIDVNASVCLHEGLLELVACTKGSKEHESIISIESRPVHIHAALLLFGTKPGTPGLRMVSDAKGVRWIPVEPAGDRVRVSLVFPDIQGKLQEHPIQKFIALAQSKKISGLTEDSAPPRKFPSSFLFAGSHLVNDGPGPKKYLSGQSGNVISISSFGDELLCLSEVYGHENDGLVWEVNPKSLPKVGTPVILRLRPVRKAPSE
ncbi:MAG: YdjY domain-containing protein [Nitrospinaceae bacterium]|jgi:hypothetical protein|nr:YdjY domain-containing protein [Nitrospinaceae bacterium]